MKNYIRLKALLATPYRKMFLIMRISVVLLLFSLQISATNYAQDLLNLKANDITIADVFKRIEHQSNYKFYYSNDIVPVDKFISINVINAPINEVMLKVLEGTNLHWKVLNKNRIVISPVSVNDSVNTLNIIPITGIIRNEKGEPLEGISIIIKGTTTGIITSSTGQFTINAPANAVLEISGIGYETTEYRINGNDDITIVLKAIDTRMDEVVVIGYGTTTRREVTGAVDQIKSSQITDRPVANLTQALQGAAPSLNIQQRSMNPNDNTMNINIRGISTMNSNSPLIVIDGLVSDNASLNKLNPSDIESISVLKDAGTSAIYGSRSANGVLLITTKKGRKNQRPIFRVNAQFGVEDPDVLFRPVMGYQNATLKNLALTNVGSSPEFTPEEIRDLYDHRSEEKWYYDQILKTALQQNYSASVSGGSANTTYLFSGGYYDQQSNFVGNNFGISRFNLRSNITTEYGRFKFTSILAYTRNNTNATTASNAIINSTRIPPYYYYKMQADNGKYLVNNALTDQNPLAELREGGYEKYDNDYFNVNLGVDMKIVEGLKLRGVFGADMYADHRFIRRIQVPLYSSEDATTPLVYVNSTRNTEDYNNKSYLLNYQLLLDYNKIFGRHHVTGLLGATNESYTRRANEIKWKYTDPILGTPTTGSELATDSYNTPSATTETSISSVLGRAGYNYDEKYYADFSFRYDGSSKFAKNNRWGFFPSASLGWRVSEEPFMKSYKEKIGDLKFRGSYGVLGNQDIDAYQYLTVYSATTNTYGFNNTSVSGAAFTYGNKDLRWETTHTINVGMDATFLKNALLFTIEYFHKTTKDILITPEIPTVFGTTLSKTNAGEMENQGWELTLDYHFRTGNVEHNVIGNVGDSWNKVTKFEGDEQISTNDNISKIIRVGLPFNAYYGYKMAGYFQSMEEIETSALPVGISPTDLRPGDVKYIDRNNDGIIDSKDRYVLGNAFPRYTFGLTYNLSFKGFDFSMFWQGVGKRDMMVRGELVEPFHENYSYVIYKHQLDFWTPTNTDAQWPRLTATGSTSRKNNFQMGSDLFKFDGSYARLKNIQIGYTIPGAFSKKLGVQKIHVYLNAQNILTLSANSWVDPESSEFDSNMSGAANSARNYPTLKYYGGGLNVEF